MKFISNHINTVIQGDCLSVMETFPSRCIDMVLCDLPYGITHNSWDNVIDLEKLWLLYKRIIKSNGIVVLTSQGKFTGQLITSNPAMFRYKMVWIKSKATNFLNAKKQPLRKHEDICVFYGGKSAYNPQMLAGMPYDRGIRKALTENYNFFKPCRVCNVTGNRYPNDTLFYPENEMEDYVYFKTAESEGKVWHANQKPLALGRYLVRTFSNPGDLILDNACGSGSFLVAAMLEGRNFIGIEKNELQFRLKQKAVDYIEICKIRIKEAKKINH